MFLVVNIFHVFCLLLCTVQCTYYMVRIQSYTCEYTQYASILMVVDSCEWKLYYFTHRLQEWHHKTAINSFFRRSNTHRIKCVNYVVRRVELKLSNGHHCIKPRHFWMWMNSKHVLFSPHVISDSSTPVTMTYAKLKYKTA